MSNPVNALLQKSMEPTEIFEVMAVDALRLPVPEDKPEKYCLTIVEYLSRYLWAIPVDDLRAETVYTVLMTHVFFPFAWPKILLTDNGSEFKNDLIDALCDLGKTERRYTTPYHPQTNGLAERMNQEIIRGLAAAVMETGADSSFSTFVLVVTQSCQLSAYIVTLASLLVDSGSSGFHYANKIGLILGMAHSEMEQGGHLKAPSMILRYTKEFWWPGMSKSIIGYARGCQICQIGGEEGDGRDDGIRMEEKRGKVHKRLRPINSR
jgi:hypothetical protein